MNSILKASVFLSLVVVFLDAAGVQERIINDGPEKDAHAQSGEFPYMVQLYQVVVDDKVEVGCGGSIIGEKWILTASHCVGDSMYIRYGSINRDKGNKIEVAKVYKHPNFTWDNLSNNDIAILELSSPIVSHKPIKLPKQNEKLPAEVKDGTIIGWGHVRPDTVFFNKPSSILKKLKVNVINHELCRQRFPSSWLIKNRVGDQEVCVYGTVGREGACRGDSGGPLIINDTLWGIASTVMRINCAKGPALYTVTSAHINWIDKVVNSA